MAFAVRAVPGTGAWTVQMSGEADASVVPEMDLAFRQAAAGEETMLVDLSEVTFLDSRTMAVLEGWARQMRAAGRRMPLICGKDEILRLFRIIGLDREFEFHPDRASALAG